MGCQCIHISFPPLFVPRSLTVCSPTGRNGAAVPTKIGKQRAKPFEIKPLMWQRSCLKVIMEVKSSTRVKGGQTPVIRMVLRAVEITLRIQVLSTRKLPQARHLVLKNIASYRKLRRRSFTISESPVVSPKPHLHNQPGLEPYQVSTTSIKPLLPLELSSNLSWIHQQELPSSASLHLKPLRLQLPIQLQPRPGFPTRLEIPPIQ